MTDQPTLPTRGNPPNREQLANRLGDRSVLWNEVRETIAEIGAVWKWVYGDATRTWSYRSHQEGNRFFASMTLTDDGFEVSFNLKATELAAITPLTPEEAKHLATLRDKASSEDPAWIHYPVKEQSDLSLLAKLLVARAQRIQKPRLKPGKKRK